MILAANLKCNHTRASFEQYTKALDEGLAGGISREDEILVFPPASAFCARVKNFTQGAQNFYPATHGSFTGEIGGDMLAEFDIKTVLIGHSERRAILGESAELIREKFSFAAAQGWRIVFCVGEDEAAFAQDRSEEFVAAQLEGIDLKYRNLILAYEPVWAIGTGKFAAPRDVSRAVKLIRKQIKQLFGALAAKHVRVLYGGSVNVDNASAYLQIDGVDGLLIGDTSLDVRAFAEIIKKADVIDKAVARKAA